MIEKTRKFIHWIYFTLQLYFDATDLFKSILLEQSELFLIFFFGFLKLAG